MRLAGLSSLRIRPWIPTAFAVAAAAAYLVAGRAEPLDQYPDLARAFLDGHLWVPYIGGMEQVPLENGRAYVPFPPVPALTYMPFLAAGWAPTSAMLTAVVGGIGVGLTYLLLVRLECRAAGVITAGLASATFGWAAATAGTWLYAQVLAFTLAVAALHVAVRARWPLAAGVLLALAAGSRLPVGLMLPLLLYFFRADRRRSWPLVVAGVVAVAIPIALYNVARFGSPIDFGYAHIESVFHPGETVLAERWFADGVMSLSYIPRSIAAMMLNGPIVGPEFPYVTPSVSGVSVALAAPMFLLAVAAPRTQLTVVSLTVAGLVMIPNWSHGSWGFHQFGYRFLIDAMPALLVALAVAYRGGPSRWLVAAVVVGATANAYGLWASGAERMFGF